MSDQQGHVMATHLAVFDGLEAADGDREVTHGGDTWVYFVHGCAGRNGQPGRMVYSSAYLNVGTT